MFLIQHDHYSFFFHFFIYIFFSSRGGRKLYMVRRGNSTATTRTGDVKRITQSQHIQSLSKKAEVSYHTKYYPTQKHLYSSLPYPSALPLPEQLPAVWAQLAW